MNTENFSFEGKAGEYFKIWIVNILLTILTLGIYSAWATVRNNRYFYGNTKVNGTSFEYHAKPMQLLYGRLLAMAVLIIYVAVDQFYPQGSPVLLLLLVLITPWIIWRSLQFNARMSSYQNVRFSFVGSLKKLYTYLFFIPSLPFLVSGLIMGLSYLSSGEFDPQLFGALLGFSFLSFYLLVPFIQARLTQYTVSQSRYGQGYFSCAIGSGKYYSTYFKAFFAMVGFVLLVVLLGKVIGTVADGMFDFIKNEVDSTSEGISQSVIVGIGLIYLIMLIVGTYLRSYVQSTIRNYVYANTGLDDTVKMCSTLKTKSLFTLQLSNLFIIIFSLGFGIPWVKIRSANYVADHTSVEIEGDINSYVSQQQSKQSAIGSELGEAFDVEAGFEVGI